MSSRDFRGEIKAGSIGAMRQRWGYQKISLPPFPKTAYFFKFYSRKQAKIGGRGYIAFDKKQGIG